MGIFQIPVKQMRLGLYLLIQPGRVTGLDWGGWKWRTSHSLELDPPVLPVLFFSCVPFLFLTLVRCSHRFIYCLL